MDITAIILTYNEKLHLERCINSLKPVCTRICVVDSFSTDSTVSIAQRLGADVYHNKWENNYAKQFNWGIENCNISTAWTMRMDADEYLLPETADEIRSTLTKLEDEITGLNISRRVIFKGKWLRHGGFYPIHLLRIWRTGVGTCEQRLMDEHITLTRGIVKTLNNDLVDENYNGMHWWVNKHNNYARREATDILDKKYGLIGKRQTQRDVTIKQARYKRILKEKVYNNLPLGFRPAAYFLYRFLFQLGFLDGPKGCLFHFLQGFWYRLIVDINIWEIETQAKGDRDRIREVITKEWGIMLD